MNNPVTHPLYVSYMALHLANKTIDEIPFASQHEMIRETYARNEDVKSFLWGLLTGDEKDAVKKYNKEHQLA